MNPRTFPSGAFKAPALGRYANPPAAGGVAVAGCTPHHRIRGGGAVQPVAGARVWGARRGAVGTRARGPARRRRGRHTASPAWTRRGGFWRIAQGGRCRPREVWRFGGCAGFARARLWVQPAPSCRSNVPRRGTPAAMAVPAPEVSHVAAHGNRSPAPRRRPPGRRGAPARQARDLRLPARPGVLRRRGHRPDPARRRHRPDPAAADPPDQRRPVHVRHRLDHPVGRVLEDRRAAAAAAGGDLHRASAR